ncbi:MAG: polysaccharide biosynthesis C-terminal domain-containing protein [Victivallaceae bacterium]|nr:polysaccharide biosynthesis C-terminal domain-containing protein [Victivallaceae bacterium]
MAFQDFIVRHKGTLTNLLVYFLASVVPMVLNIVSMPLFSCYLSAEDFAVVGFYSSLSLLFAPLISFFLLHNYMRSYFQCDEKGREQLHVETTQLLVYFSAVLAVVSVALIWGYQNWFNRNSRIAVLPYAPYAMFYLSAAGLLNLKLTQLKMQKKSLPYFVYNSVNAVLTVGFSVFFVMLGGGSAGKLGGVFLGGFLLFGYFLWDAREYLFRKMQWGSVRRMLVFCFPLMLAAMLGFFSNGYDKVFLERHISLKELGYYSVGVSISHFLYVFSDAISSTFSPDIYESVAKKDFRRCSYFVLLKIVLITLIVIPFVVFAPPIVNLLTAWKYQKAIPFCVITAFSSVTASLYYSLSQITIAMNHNKIPLLTRIVGSCLTIGMFYVLIQKWGTYGAAWGVVLNFLVYFLCNFLFLAITLFCPKTVIGRAFKKKLKSLYEK